MTGLHCIWKFPKYNLLIFILHTMVCGFFPIQTETVNVITNEQDRRPDELYAILRDFLHQVYFR